MYRLIEADPLSHDARAMQAALSAVLSTLTGSSGETSFSSADIAHHRAVFLLAYDRAGVVCGCGALRPVDSQTAELKRMYAAPGTVGLGTSLLLKLEEYAVSFGYERVWLETRRSNRRAVTFYLRHGYQPIENYGPYIGRSEAVCFGKEMTC